MKILHVNIVNYGGGLEQYLEQLFKELDIRGHKNFFLYGQKCADEKLPNYSDKYYIDKVTHFKCNNLSSKLAKVNKILENIDPDVILIHQVLNPHLIDLLTFETTSVRFVHGFKLICPQGSKTLNIKKEICKSSLSYRCQLKAYTDRCMPRNPIISLPIISKSKENVRLHKKRSHMVVASEYMKSVLLYNGFDKEKITVIPYFTHIPKFKNSYHSNNPPNILALGRLVKTKGMHYLLKAFCNVNKKAHLTIVGDGPEFGNLKELAKKLNLTHRVSFCGWISHEKLDLIFRKSDIVVVPSIWPEPFGIVGIEAMSYQKPVLAFNVGGISEWCKDKKTGYLIETKNYKELADKINMLLYRRDVANEMGKEGRISVERRFTPEIHIKRLIPLLNQIIN